MAKSTRTPAHKRVLARTIAAPGGCIIYTGTGKRYGYVDDWDGSGKKRPRLAHRVMYEAMVGPIPEGLHIDHLCRVTRCVNHHHLEAVTQAENNRRTGRAECNKGHAKVPGERCKTCALDYQRARAARLTDEQLAERRRKQRAYREKNKEAIAARVSAAYYANPEPAKARSRKAYLKKKGLLDGE